MTPAGKTAGPDANLKVWGFALAQCNRFLGCCGTSSIEESSGDTDNFTPLVFSAGGFVEGKTMQ